MNDQPAVQPATPSASDETRDSAVEREVDSTRSFEQPGESADFVIGRYTLVEKLGEGGMGEVWVAKQSEPVKRKVALKLIKKGMDSRAVLQRFEQERQALAVMDHPNIAKVLDGGITTGEPGASATGVPYFVMELVVGATLTKFCDEAKLGIRERLELFVPICQAVQHAHQKGIIHRDLKPANILVTLVDGKPIPKIIDFGVAKATSGKLTEETLSTHIGAVVGTLEYMAPEQAGVTVADVDTRADIYSLGVILYELLTGLRPFDSRRLRRAAMDEMLRVIREEDPPSLASRLSTDEMLPSNAAVRSVEPRRLVSLVKGELDWIARRCLEKNRNRRYETANALARDVQRYLADEPVEARPVSSTYRFKKYLRKHRFAASMVGLLVAALVAGIAGTSWQAYRATQAEGKANEQAGIAVANAKLAGDRLALVEEEQKRTLEQKIRAEKNEKTAIAKEAEAKREREVAVAVRRFLQMDLLNQGNPWQQAKLGGRKAGPTLNPTIKELLDRAAAKLADPKSMEEFRTRPQVYSEIVTTVVNAYLALNESEKALKLSKALLAFHLKFNAQDDLQVLEARSRVAAAAFRAKKLAEMATQFAEIAAAIEANVTAPAAEGLHLGLRQFDRGLDTAEEQFLELPTFDHPHDVGATDLALMAFPLLRAKGSADRIAAALRKSLGPDDRYVHMVHCWTTLANSLTGRQEDTIAGFERSLAGLERGVGPEHVWTWLPRSLVAFQYERTRRYDLAARHYERILEHVTKRLGARHPHVASAQQALGRCYLQTGRYDAGLDLLEKARSSFHVNLGEDHDKTIAAAEEAANAFSDAGRHEQVLKLRGEIARIHKAKHGPGHVDTLLSMNSLAVASCRVGRHADALPIYEDTLRRCRATLGTNHETTLTIMVNLAVCLGNLGRNDQAVPLLEESLRLCKAKHGASHSETLHAMNALGFGYDQAGRFNEAVRTFRELLRLRRSALGDDDPETCSSMHNLAMTLMGVEQAEAVTLSEECVRRSRLKRGADHPDTFHYMVGLARCYGESGDFAKAIPLYEEAHQGTRKRLGPEAAGTLELTNGFANLLLKAGRTAEAQALFEESLSIRRKVLGAEHRDTLTSMNNCAAVHMLSGRLTDAHALFEETLRLMKVKLRAEDQERLLTTGNFADCLFAMGKQVESLPYYEEAARGLEKTSFNSSYSEGIIQSTVKAYMDVGRPAEAESWSRKWLDAVKARSGESSARYASATLLFASSLAAQSRWTEAEAAARKALEVSEKLAPGSLTASMASLLLGRTLFGQKKFADAELILLKGWRGLKEHESKIPPKSRSETLAKAVDRLIELYTATNKPDEVKKWQAERAKYAAAKTSAPAKKNEKPTEKKPEPAGKK